MKTLVGKLYKIDNKNNYFLYLMIELVHENELVMGQKYYVKRKYILNNLYKKKLNFDAKFDGYSIEFQGFAWFRPNKYIRVELSISDIIIYRYVSKEEYYEKLKEKYDAKCLNIVLKDLIDDTFSW
jgi:hypothetical protein